MAIRSPKRFANEMCVLGGIRIATPDDIGHWLAMTRLVAEVLTIQLQFGFALVVKSTTKTFPIGEGVSTSADGRGLGQQRYLPSQLVPLS